jgi:hypothetical protein
MRSFHGQSLKRDPHTKTIFKSRVPVVRVLNSLSVLIFSEDLFLFTSLHFTSLPLLSHPTQRTKGLLCARISHVAIAAWDDAGSGWGRAVDSRGAGALGCALRDRSRRSACCSKIERLLAAARRAGLVCDPAIPGRQVQHGNFAAASDAAIYLFSATRGLQAQRRTTPPAMVRGPQIVHLLQVLLLYLLESSRSGKLLRGGHGVGPRPRWGREAGKIRGKAATPRLPRRPPVHRRVHPACGRRQW